MPRALGQHDGPGTWLLGASVASLMAFHRPREMGPPRLKSCYGLLPLPHPSPLALLGFAALGLPVMPALYFSGLVQAPHL